MCIICMHALKKYKPVDAHTHDTYIYIYVYCILYNIQIAHSYDMLCLLHIWSFVSAAGYGTMLRAKGLHALTNVTGTSKRSKQPVAEAKFSLGHL